MPSLLPERALAFSPSLAATLGLEEAILLAGLQELALHASSPMRDAGLQWQHAEQTRLRLLFPFWTDKDVARIVQSLVDKGVVELNSGDYCAVKHLYFALNDGRIATRQHSEQASKKPIVNAEQTPAAQPRTIKTALPRDWQADADTLQQLKQHGIEDAFIASQLPEFIHYWCERGDTSYAWGNKFLKHVVQAWRRHQAGVDRSAPMSRQWSPSEDALEILQRIDISADFIQDAVPEFVLYWRERGDGISTWNSKFVAHVKTQWARYNSALEYDNEPRPLPANWQPSQDVFEILSLANIDHHFAQQQLPAFCLFWKEDRRQFSSWNTKFLQHVKYQWARQHQLGPDYIDTNQRDRHAGQRHTGQDSSGPAEANQSTFDRLTDRSWASHL